MKTIKSNNHFILPRLIEFSGARTMLPKRRQFNETRGFDTAHASHGRGRNNTISFSGVIIENSGGKRFHGQDRVSFELLVYYVGKKQEYEHRHKASIEPPYK